MKFLIIYFFALIVVFSINAVKVRYDNYRVYNVLLKKDQNVNNQLNQYSIWSSNKELDNQTENADVMVSPEKILEFQNLMKMYKVEYEEKIKNVQKLIDDEVSINFKAKQKFGWQSYHNLDEINNWLNDIVQMYPKIVKPFVIGKSFEKRAINGVKLSYKNGNPGIFIEANIHAREWITSATATYFINELLTSNNTNIRQIAENYDWYIIPVLNVDGFVHTKKVDRMWRKTRQPNKGSNCIGTDGNRNFDSHWLENNGASRNPCDETYAGPKPFSEPETKALADYYDKIKDNISIYLSFHSYSQLLLSPYGHVGDEFPSNYNDMQTIAKATTDAIKKRYNTSYRYGSTASVLYVASGASTDWAYNEKGTKLTYTFEFRDKGKYGFLLPPEYIIPNSEEIVDGIIAMIGEAKKLQIL